MGEFRERFGNTVANAFGEAPDPRPVDTAAEMLRSGIDFETVQRELGHEVTFAAIGSDPDLRVRFGLSGGSESAA